MRRRRTAEGFFGGCCADMGGARAPTAATACVSRLDSLKLERTRGNLGTRTLSSSSRSPCSSSPARDVCSPAAAPHPHLEPLCVCAGGACGCMDPAVLIFLLYMMIAHELLCGWMQYRKQGAKPRTRAAGPLLRPRCVRVRVCDRDVVSVIN